MQHLDSPCELATTDPASQNEEELRKCNTRMPPSGYVHLRNSCPLLTLAVKYQCYRLDLGAIVPSGEKDKSSVVHSQTEVIHFQIDE